MSSRVHVDSEPSAPSVRATRRRPATRTTEVRGGGTVRAIARALQVLAVMNARAVWPLHELQAATQLPKATLSRILNTLAELGYVRREARVGVYALTSDVRRLAAGFTEQSRIVEVGGPILLELTRRIQWPLALGVLDRDAIVVRFSSMPYSPLAVHTTTLGHRLGVTDTAMGRAYLAFCSDVERDDVFTHLVAAGSPVGSWFVEQTANDLARVRASGFAVRRPNAARGSATLAAPVLKDGVAEAVIGMTTFGRSLTQAVIDKHHPLLVQAAAAIVDACTQT